jgi:exopolyphosphatase/guanosine-5'-triphosphate,3'-diphosphate pyrophosphatase
MRSTSPASSSASRPTRWKPRQRQRGAAAAAAHGARPVGVIRVGKPKQVVVSASAGEGLLYRLLDAETRKQDPLLAAAGELNTLRSRSPRHGAELVAWTDGLFASLAIDEHEEQRRLRHAACLLADIGWRAHPDYRGEQSLNIIAHAAFVGIDHASRAFLALAVFYRHVGLSLDQASPRIRN